MDFFSLEHLSKVVSGEIKGDPKKQIHNIEDFTSCNNNSICFIKSDVNLNNLSSNAGAILTTSQISKKINEKFNFIIVDDPYLGFARLTDVFFQIYESKNNKVESSFGKNFVIGKNSVINRNCVIGNNVRIHDNVSIYPNTHIGDNCIIHSGVVVGSDGFGFAPVEGGWRKIHHLGGVEIGNNVEIGANTVIDRGVLGNTVLSDGVILDNQIHIAHNVQIGKNTAIAAQTAIAGSVTIGSNCQLSGHVGIAGHLNIANGVTVLAHTFVTKSIKKSGIYSGIMPMQEHSDSLKFIANLKNKK